jgi:hypothetical protein
MALGFLQAPAGAATIYAAPGDNASDSNPGTAAQPLRTVAKAVSLAKPGDTVLFSEGTYPCSRVAVPDGSPDYPIILRSDGKGKVVFTNDGTGHILELGNYNTIDGIEFDMVSENPKGSGIHVARKEHEIIRKCRFTGCRIGVHVESSHYIYIENSEMAYSGFLGIYFRGGGSGVKGHRSPADENRHIEVRNCYVHDTGWSTPGAEACGIDAYGAVEDLLIENCQIDNSPGDGILFEDWGVHTTARYNVIRGSGIVGIWIDNASMSIFDSNYLEANSAAVWLSGEFSANRFLDDFISIRNNIFVHNDFTPMVAFEPRVYGRSTILITSNARDVYFDNNTIAYNVGRRLIDVENRPPQNIFRNIWFRNNIFWGNKGEVAADKGIDLGDFHFAGNLWDRPYAGDAQAKTGDPLFADPNAHAPEGYRLQGESAARGQGALLYENPLDFWNGRRPHLSKSEKYDIGAHQFAGEGTAHIGLDLSTFPYEVPPFVLRWKAKPPR